MTYPVVSRTSSLKSIKRLRLGSVPMKHGYRNVPFRSNIAQRLNSGHIKPTTGRVPMNPDGFKKNATAFRKVEVFCQKMGVDF